MYPSPVTAPTQPRGNYHYPNIRDDDFLYSFKLYGYISKQYSSVSQQSFNFKQEFLSEGRPYYSMTVCCSLFILFVVFHCIHIPGMAYSLFHSGWCLRLSLFDTVMNNTAVNILYLASGFSRYSLKWDCRVTGSGHVCLHQKNVCF